MTKANLSKALIAGVFAACCLATASPASANLLHNGSFESPIVPGTSTTCGAVFTTDCRGYFSDDQVGGVPAGESKFIGSTPATSWETIGLGGADGVSIVMQLGENYTETNASGGPLYFHAQDGKQSLDLTGEGNQGLTNGIKQSVTTEAGRDYILSFHVGNQYDQAPGYGTASTIALYINGLLIDSFTNANNLLDDVDWLQFSLVFTATDFTTIAFLNGTAVGDNYAGLDNIVLRTVPEPATLALLLTGLGAAAATRRRRVRQAA